MHCTKTSEWGGKGKVKHTKHQSWMERIENENIFRIYYLKMLIFEHKKQVFQICYIVWNCIVNLSINIILFVVSIKNAVTNGSTKSFVIKRMINKNWHLSNVCSGSRKKWNWCTIWMQQNQFYNFHFWCLKREEKKNQFASVWCVFI